ncbi:hypothetical protein D9M72_391330 [compost metagenome]
MADDQVVAAFSIGSICAGGCSRNRQGIFIPLIRINSIGYAGRKQNSRAFAKHSRTANYWVFWRQFYSHSIRKHRSKIRKGNAYLVVPVLCRAAYSVIVAYGSCYWTIVFMPLISISAVGSIGQVDNSLRSICSKAGYCNRYRSVAARCVRGIRSDGYLEARRIFQYKYFFGYSITSLGLGYDHFVSSILSSAIAALVGSDNQDIISIPYKLRLYSICRHRKQFGFSRQDNVCSWRSTADVDLSYDKRNRVRLSCTVAIANHKIVAAFRICGICTGYCSRNRQAVFMPLIRISWIGYAGRKQNSRAFA